jgi:restriction endonuclease S subunit
LETKAKKVNLCVKMSRILKFGEILDLKIGVYAKPVEKGDAYFLQVKDLDSSKTINLSNNRNLYFHPGLVKHLLILGDVLLVAKGSYNPAFTFSGSSIPVVASTTFLILRILPDFHTKILPDYLTWYLNLPDTQQQLRAYAKGTSIPSISISILAQLNIDVPSLKTQEQILKIQQLRDREREIRTAIDKLSQRLVQHQLQKAIKRS